MSGDHESDAREPRSAEEPTPSPEPSPPDPAAAPLPAGAPTWVSRRPAPAPRPRRRLPDWFLFPISALSLLATLVTATGVGTGLYLATRTDVTTDLPGAGVLQFEAIRRVWADPELTAIGLRYAVPLLFILLCHELGHYLACRRYGVSATPPIFLPMPFALGTFGAFIRIRDPIPDRRKLLDIGAAGPIAGFVALLPFLLYGVAQSRPAPVYPPSAQELESLQFPILFKPGNCLAIRLVSLVFHGRLPENSVLDLHPFAFAAWVGLFATALNLLPLGQLDGGHILFAWIGRRQWRIAWPVWGIVVLCGLLWPGWFLLALLVLLVGVRHPPVPGPGLDPRRRWVAAGCLLLLALTFIPVPISLVPVTAGPAPGLLASLFPFH